MRSLVIGGRGLIGTALVRGLVSEYGAKSVTYTTRTGEPSPHLPDAAACVKLDLLGPRLPAGKFNVVYIVAANPKLIECEKPGAWRVNADGPAALVLQNRQLFDPAHVVFVSSDVVEIAPQLSYAAQKLYVESLVLATSGAVVRPGRCSPETVGSLVRVLIRAGQQITQGLVRWQGEQV